MTLPAESAVILWLSLYIPTKTIVRPRWVDHSLKIRAWNLQYARTGHAKNEKNVKDMYVILNVWRFLFNYTFTSV